MNHLFTVLGIANCEVHSHPNPDGSEIVDSEAYVFTISMNEKIDSKENILFALMDTLRDLFIPVKNSYGYFRRYLVIANKETKLSLIPEIIEEYRITKKEEDPGHIIFYGFDE